MSKRRHGLEWLVSGISAVILLFVVGVLVRSAVTTSDRAPELEIRLGPPRAAGRHFRVPVEVHNRGDVTAVGAHVEVVLRRAGAEVERSEVVLSFVPRRSRRSGWAVFRHDPACCQLSARPVGFEAP
jgi:uncharacterized protein (TIGR02588 family)